MLRIITLQQYAENLNAWNIVVSYNILASLASSFRRPLIGALNKLARQTMEHMHPSLDAIYTRWAAQPRPPGSPDAACKIVEYVVLYWY